MCDDLISRQYAIDFFLAKGMITAGVYVERMPSAQRWIPVTERLPERNTICLITTSKGVVVQVMFFGANMNGHMVWRSFGGEYVYWDEEVVAYMPLPEPWKGEE